MSNPRRHLDILYITYKTSLSSKTVLDSTLEKVVGSNPCRSSTFLFVAVSGDSRRLPPSRFQWRYAAVVLLFMVLLL